jgi:NAD+ diphosphatase
MEMHFCRRCGKELEHVRDHIYTCANGHTLYANSSPAVGVYFISPDNTQVLLATRGIEPHKGKLDTPGGFLDGNENYEEALVRELREEVGLEPSDYEPLQYLCSANDTYPYQGENMPYISCLYWSRLIGSPSLSSKDDVASVDWYELADVKPEQLHANDIRKGIRLLQEMFTKKD